MLDMLCIILNSEVQNSRRSYGLKNIAMIFERLTRIMTSRFHHGWAGQSVIQLSLLVYFLPNILMFTSRRGGVVYDALLWTTVNCWLTIVLCYTGNGGLWRFTGSQLGYGSVSEGTGAAVRCRRG